MKLELPRYEIAALELVDYCFEADTEEDIESLIRQFIAKEPKVNQPIIQFIYKTLYGESLDFPKGPYSFEAAGEEQGMGINSLFQVVRLLENYLNPKSKDYVKDEGRRLNFFLQQLETLDALDANLIVRAINKEKELRVGFPQQVLEKILKTH